MIKLLSTISMVLLLALFPNKPKENKYTLTEGEMIMLYNAADQTKRILPTSQAPAIQVTQITQSLDSIQRVLAVQYNSFHPDTLSNKKK